MCNSRTSLFTSAADSSEVRALQPWDIPKAYSEHFEPADCKSALRSQTGLRKRFAGQSQTENALGDSQSAKPVRMVLPLGHFVRANLIAPLQGCF